MYLLNITLILPDNESTRHAAGRANNLLFFGNGFFVVVVIHFRFFFLRMKGFISYNMHVYLYKSGKYQITKEINL